MYEPERTRLAAVTAAVLLALSGCTLSPRYERPAAPVASEFPGAAAGSPQGSTPGSAGASAAQIGWQTFIAEPRLQKLVELALAGNRDLRVATLNVQQSQAQYRITRSSAFPTLDASGGYSRQHSSVVTSGSTSSGFTTESWNASVGVTAYELDLFGRVRSLSEQALQQYFATEEAQRSARLSLVAEVATQYFTLREAEEQLALAHQTLDSVQQLYQLNQALFNAGAVGELDLRTAEGQVQNARINVLTYERLVAQGQNALVLLIGAPIPQELPASGPFDDSTLLAQIPPGMPSDLLERRPDILQAEHVLQAANANVGAARAAFFPTISLTGSVGRSSSELSDLFGGSSRTWSFAPQISVPIFTGGRNRANLDVSQIETRIEVANYEKSIQTAFREVADALIADSTFASEIEAPGVAIQAQQRRLELADARYRQGEDTYLNVLSAQQDLYSARQGRLQAQFNRLSSHIALYKALGGGWE